MLLLDLDTVHVVWRQPDNELGPIDKLGAANPSLSIVPRLSQERQ